ncbi:MAG: trypsin-like peptidase domain-containing protein [Alphaproteobacteria bacterium]|nr:trypsin-like peptidase domain-containing protein [Alphaproteobacteria bacterium]
MPLLLSTLLAASLASAQEAPPATLAACTADAVALPAGLDARSQAVVRVHTLAGSGSGVVVSPDGWVLTAAHVVGKARTVTLALRDGSELEGEVVRVHDGADLALVHAAGAPPCAPLAPTPAAPGSETWVVGSPTGEALSHSISKGIVSGWREGDGWALLQTDASVNPGNSGGPVFDAEGRVQAIVSSKRVGVGVEGLAFGVGVAEVGRALGVSAGAASGEVSPWRGGQVAAAGVATVTGGPATRTPLPVRKACTKAKARQEEDGFEGTLRTRVDANDFRLRWGEGQPTVLSLKFFLFGMIFRGGPQLPPGWATVDLALEDGTRLHLVSEGGTAAVTMMGSDAWPEFTIDEAVITALAASPPKAMRWSTNGSSPQDRDLGSSLVKQLPAAAVCRLEE